jgi:hypothetical protein
MADDVLRDPSQFAVPSGARVIDRFNLSRVSWGAIWAGAMVTLGMEALFLSFGIFIDAALDGSTPWAMAWYLVTMAISFFVGGWSAARLSDVPAREISVLHGLTTWGLATLSTVLIFGAVVLSGVRLGTALVLSGPAAAPAPAAFNLWGPLEEYGGLIWGGVVLSLLTACLGGARALPGSSAPVGQQPGTTQMRRAS